MDKVMMSMMGTQGFRRSWRYLTFKMASCDSPSVKLASCKYSQVCHINKILTSCGFSLFKNSMHLLKAQRVTLLAWIQNSSPSNMPSEHINRPYNVTSCSSLQPYIIYTCPSTINIPSLPSQVPHFFLFCLCPIIQGSGRVVKMGES